MVKLVDDFLVAVYPLINAVALAIVVYQNIRYKKRIKELEQFKERIQAALNLPYEERT